MSDVQTGNTPPGNGEIGRENRVVETTKRKRERRGKVDGRREGENGERGWREEEDFFRWIHDSVSSRTPAAIRLYRFVNRSIKGDVHLYALLGKIYERCRGRGPKV